MAHLRPRAATPATLRSTGFVSARLPIASIAAALVAGLLIGCVSDPSTSAPKRMFATSQSYAGNFGGASAADSICATLAEAALLGGKWNAFLSDDSLGALARTREVGPWFRVDRKTKIFNNRTGFTVGALVTIQNEYGDAVPTSARAWTGTRSDGTADGTQNCSNWTSTSGYGRAGNPNKLLAEGPKWMYAADGSAPCASTYRLYCFER
jgi:hypothetical protein